MTPDVGLIAYVYTSCGNRIVTKVNVYGISINILYNVYRNAVEFDQELPCYSNEFSNIAGLAEHSCRQTICALYCWPSLYSPNILE